MATHFSILADKFHEQRVDVDPTVHGSHKRVGHDLGTKQQQTSLLFSDIHV